MVLIPMAARRHRDSDVLLAIPAGTDSDCRSESVGRYPFAARQCASGGAVYCNGTDVLQLGDSQPGELVDCNSRTDPLRGHHECL